MVPRPLFLSTLWPQVEAERSASGEIDPLEAGEGVRRAQPHAGNGVPGYETARPRFPSLGNCRPHAPKEPRPGSGCRLGGEGGGVRGGHNTLLR